MVEPQVEESDGERLESPVCLMSDCDERVLDETVIMLQGEVIDCEDEIGVEFSLASFLETSVETSTVAGGENGHPSDCTIEMEDQPSNGAATAHDEAVDFASIVAVNDEPIDNGPAVKDSSMKKSTEQPHLLAMKLKDSSSRWGSPTSNEVVDALPQDTVALQSRSEPEVTKMDSETNNAIGLEKAAPETNESVTLSADKEQDFVEPVKSSHEANSEIETTTLGVRLARETPGDEETKPDSKTMIIANDSSANEKVDDGTLDADVTDLILEAPFSVMDALGERKEICPVQDKKYLITMSRTQVFEAIESGQSEFLSAPEDIQDKEGIPLDDAKSSEPSMSEECDSGSSTSSKNQGVEIALTTANQVDVIDMSGPEQRAAEVITETSATDEDSFKVKSSDDEELKQDQEHKTSPTEAGVMHAADSVIDTVSPREDEPEYKDQRELESSEFVDIRVHDAQLSPIIDSTEDITEDIGMQSKPKEETASSIFQLAEETTDECETAITKTLSRESTANCNMQSEQQQVFLQIIEGNEPLEESKAEQEPSTTNEYAGSLNEAYTRDNAGSPFSMSKNDYQECEREGIEFPIALSLKLREDELPERSNKKSRKSFLLFSKRAVRKKTAVTQSKESGSTNALKQDVKVMDLPDQARHEGLVEIDHGKEIGSTTSALKSKGTPKPKISSRMATISSKTWFINRHQSGSISKEDPSSDDATLVTAEDASFASTNESEDETLQMTSGGHPVTTFLFSFDGDKLIEKDQSKEVMMATPARSNDDVVEEETDGFDQDGDAEWTTLRFDGKEKETSEESTCNVLPSDFMDAQLNSDLRATMSDVVEKIKVAGSCNTNPADFCGDKFDDIGAYSDAQTMVIVTCSRDYSTLESFGPMKIVRNEISNQCALDYDESDDDNSLVFSEEDEDSLFVALEETSVQCAGEGSVSTELRAAC